MHFSREALRGIFDALSEAERSDLLVIFRKQVRMNRYGTVIDADLPVVQQVMMDHGYILPFEGKVTDAGAIEYEDIMAAQEIMSQ
jgi:hypothetical protein